MQTLSVISKLLFICVFVGSFLASPVYSQSQTLKYSYDALGRLTFVEDSRNGNRDYDYDNAGNRVNAAVGTQADGDSPGVVVLTAPTGLYVVGPFSPRGDGYRCHWNSVTGATKYEFALQNGQTSFVTRLYGESAGPRPAWVRAWNANGPGPTAYF